MASNSTICHNFRPRTRNKLLLTPAQQSINQLVQLLKTERDEDYAQYERKMFNTSIEERRKRGVTWYPVVMANRFMVQGSAIL
jgi:ATP-dependent RNA/DNA helicase IGHMBP2